MKRLVISELHVICLHTQIAAHAKLLTQVLYFKLRLIIELLIYKRSETQVTCLVYIFSSVITHHAVSTKCRDLGYRVLSSRDIDR